MNKTVAILCAQRGSIYFDLPHVEVYDRKRDARTFSGDIPVIAHPPCRSWSRGMGHWAKPEPGERELALWCVERVRRNGGILEQPAHSRLWEAAMLPKPGWPARADSWSAEVWQSWWGYPTRKLTWLWFSGINPTVVQYPFGLHNGGNDRRAFEHMSHKQRSRTTRAFAEWLVGLALLAKLRGAIG